MDYINLLHQVPNQVKNLYRKLENHHQKCIKNKWSWTFNTVCLKENLMPMFTNMLYYYRNNSYLLCCLVLKLLVNIYDIHNSISPIIIKMMKK